MLDGYNFLTQDQNNDSSSNYNNNHNHRALITMTMLKLISIHQKQQRVREYHKLEEYTFQKSSNQAIKLEYLEYLKDFGVWCEVGI